MAKRQYVQGQDFFLAGAGVTLTATTFTLSEMKYPNTGDDVAMADFGTDLIGYGTFEPETDREENISFTGIVQNADGTATLTGVTRGLLFAYDYQTLEFVVRNNNK